MAITTDSRTVAEAKDPEGNTIYQLYRLMATPAESRAMAERFRAGGYGYGDAKSELLRKILEYFGPFRKERERLLSDPAAVDAALRDGAARARAVARATLERVRRAVGLS